MTVVLISTKSKVVLEVSLTSVTCRISFQCSQVEAWVVGAGANVVEEEVDFRFD